MSHYTRKCSICKGLGKIKSLKMDARGMLIECTTCEGSGIKLQTKIEEEYNEAAEMLGDNVFADQSNFIDLEEEDYEV